MNLDAPKVTSRCCRAATPSLRDCRGRSAPAAPTTLSRRITGLVACVLSGAGLALVPKCPACVVAYLAAATGLGISLSAAAYLRTAALFVCGIVIVVTCALYFSRLRIAAGGSAANSEGT